MSRTKRSSCRRCCTRSLNSLLPSSRSFSRRSAVFLASFVRDSLVFAAIVFCLSVNVGESVPLDRKQAVQDDDAIAFIDVENAYRIVAELVYIVIVREVLHPIALIHTSPQKINQSEAAGP